jgi:streptomycin 6-kinase
MNDFDENTVEYAIVHFGADNNATEAVKNIAAAVHENISLELYAESLSDLEAHFSMLLSSAKADLKRRES